MLVFDIGSGSVGGAIVLASAAAPVRVLYSFRSDIPFQEETSGARLLPLMLRALSQAARALTHEGFDASGFGNHRPRITEAIVSLSAPWVVSRTSFVRMKNQTPALISPEIVASLIEHASHDQTAEKAAPPKGGVPIERKLVKSVLNGYETASPYGKTALEAEFAVFESFALQNMTERIADTITEVMHAHHISFHSFSLTAFAVLREIYPGVQDFILTDVSGEQTELSVVKEAIVAETATFPFGRNRLIRTVQKSARIPASGIETFFKLYNEDKGTGRLFERAKTALAKAQEAWGAELERMLAVFSGELFLPSSLYLMADNDVASIFGRAAAARDASRFTLSPAPFRVIFVDSDVLSSAVSWSSPRERDPFIGIVAAFAQRIRR